MVRGRIVGVGYFPGTTYALFYFFISTKMFRYLKSVIIRNRMMFSLPAYHRGCFVHDEKLDVK